MCGVPVSDPPHEPDPPQEPDPPRRFDPRNAARPRIRETPGFAFMNKAFTGFCTVLYAADRDRFHIAGTDMARD